MNECHDCPRQILPVVYILHCGQVGFDVFGGWHFGACKRTRLLYDDFEVPPESFDLLEAEVALYNISYLCYAVE